MSLTLITAAELARQTGIPLGTIYRRVTEGTIPYVRISERSVRFDPAEIERWLNARRVPERGGTMTADAPEQVIELAASGRGR